MGAYENAREAIERSFTQGEVLESSVQATRVEKGVSGAERGALVVTNQRIVYQGSAIFGAGSRLEWRLQQINGVARSKSMALEHIEVNAGGLTVKFLVPYGDAERFVNNANSALSTAASKHGDSSTQRQSLSDELQKLADLFEKGLLTQDEFQQAKQRLMS
jgi:hypothetical protein